MRTKLLEIKGRPVQTRVERVLGLQHVFDVKAEAGSVVVAGRITFGQDRGIGKGEGVKNYTQEMLQRDLDVFRQKLAEEAAWRAGISEMMDRVT